MDMPFFPDLSAYEINLIKDYRARKAEQEA